VHRRRSQFNSQGLYRRVSKSKHMATSRTPIIVAVVAVIVVIVAVVAVMANMFGTNAPAPPTTSNEVIIRYIGYSPGFAPSSLTVHVGENVTWVNQAGADHDIVSDNASYPFTSGILPNGQRYIHQFDQIGEFPYHCSIHPVMTGTITVIA